jgi:hypothetical protein
MARKSIVKGKAFERDAAIALREVYPDARRGLVQARAGDEAPDVEGTPFWVECKVGARINAHAALQQATAATDGRPPLAICKPDGNPVTVTMLLSDFIKLIAITQNAEAKP